MKEAPFISREALALWCSQLYQDAVAAPSTVRAYSGDWAAFTAWCLESGLSALPANPLVVGAYLAAETDLAYSTLCRRLAAIARVSALAGTPLDTRHPAIRQTLRGLSRTKSAQRRRAAALTKPDLRHLLVQCSKDASGDPTVQLTGLRDQALLLLAFGGAFRRSELVSIDVEHIAWRHDDSAITVRTSKDRKGTQPAETHIVASRNSMACPVTALRSWLEHAEIKSGPVFRKIARGGHVQASRITAAGVWQIFRKRLKQSGLKTPLQQEYFSIQSLRVRAKSSTQR